MSEESKYKAFKAGISVIIEKAYESKLKEIQNKSRAFLDHVRQRDGKGYYSLYLSNKGYIVPSFLCVIRADLKTGLFYQTRKDSYVLTKIEEPCLYEDIIQTDSEIKFIKQMFSVLSNKYDEGHLCVNFLPKILFQHFKFVPVGKTPEDLEECDKENYAKFSKLLQKNAAISLLLGESNGI